MAKHGTPPQIDQTPPSGPITWANPPIAVRARPVWNYGGPTVYDDAWVMAWTKTECYVFLITEGMSTALLVWLRADQVERS